MTDPVIFIIGPTCSGKTDLSLDVAQELGNAEIICADSRTIYRGMDIGTAKPDEKEKSIVPHHFLDIKNPNETCSAAEFKRSAEKLIKDIHKRKKIPLVVGGSGLYIFSIIYSYEFPAGASNDMRKDLESKEIDELKSILQYVNADAYQSIDLNNKRRIIRAIETAGLDRSKNDKIPSNYLVLGIAPEIKDLEKRIKKRTSNMIRNGLIEETDSLLKQYGFVEPLNTVGYREAIDHIKKGIDIDETEQLIALHTRQLAKRQMTWFKRSKHIKWAKDYTEAKNIVNKFMQI